MHHPSLPPSDIFICETLPVPLPVQVGTTSVSIPNTWYRYPVPVIPVRVIFSGVRIRLGTILGRFSIIYFRGLGLRIRVRVWVGVRVRVGVRVSVVLWSG